MALNIENIVAELKEATILELNDLVKAIEEEFGVTAAAPVAVAAAGGAEGGAAKDSFDVILKEAGASKINVIKVVRESSIGRSWRNCRIEIILTIIKGVPSGTPFLVSY